MTKLQVIGATLVFFIVMSIIGFNVFTTRVSAGEVCVQTRFGKVHDVLTPGIHYANSVTMKQTCYSKRIQTYEVSLVDPKDSNSKANYIDYKIASRTKDGVDFSAALSVQYHVDTESIVNSYEKGFRSMDELNEKIVKYHVRTLVPQILSKYTAEQLYLGDLSVASDELLALISGRTEPQGVFIDNFELKRGDFNDDYETAITNKALKVEEAKQQELQQQVATADAERKKIEAEGNANAARIEAQGEADANLIRAQAQADSETVILNQRAEIIAKHPELIQWESIQAIRSAEVIYLPSSVLPIMNLPGTTGPTP